MSSTKKDYVKNNWGKTSLDLMCNNLSVDLYQLLKIAYDLNLHKTTTPNFKRRWKEEEDNFLKEYSDELTIHEACNLLHRSRYATYQRVKFLNLNQMIGK